MKTLLATLLATAAGASFAAAPTAALNDDPAYRNVTQKAASEYKAATAKCDARSGNDKDVCMAEAKASRARTEAQAVAKYDTSAEGKAKARSKVAEAEYDVAKAKCDAKSGAEKDSCMDNAKSVRTAALADAKAGRDVAETRTETRTGATGASGSAGLVASTDTKDPAKAAAVAKCEQATGGANTGCLIDSKGNVTTLAGRAGNATERAAENTKEAAANAGDKTRAVASNAAEKTKEAAATAVDKTKQAAATVAEKTGLDGAGERLRAAGATIAQKTESALDNAGEKTREAAASARENTQEAMHTAGDKTRQAASTAADKTDRATDKAADNTRDATRGTAVAASDTAITTKVKAGIFKEPDLKSMAIHVETEKGVVMLSGFVDSKAEADKAVKVAKEVEGVTSVKSAIKVK
ncbi:BON domain-containing protein [Massilia sp.]|uniref:BON domain-containing protein n=1 Tax=Massilia sp. TaxID=1882437 RepID=UPI00289651A7|nr:BON domain-containing protein [Massilia sp.]